MTSIIQDTSAKASSKGGQERGRNQPRGDRNSRTQDNNPRKSDVKKAQGPVSDVDIMAEMFTGWSKQDLQSVLDEASGDLERAISRIAEGHVTQWSLSGLAGKKQREAERKDQERQKRQREREERHRIQREEQVQSKKPSQVAASPLGWSVEPEASKADVVAPVEPAVAFLPASWADAAVSLLPSENHTALSASEQKEEVKPVKYFTSASRAQQRQQSTKVDALVESFKQASLEEAKPVQVEAPVSVQSDDFPVVQLPASLSSRRHLVELEPNVVVLPVKAHVRTLSNISFGPISAPSKSSASTDASQPQSPRYHVMSVEASEPHPVSANSQSSSSSGSTQAPPGLAGFDSNSMPAGFAQHYYPQHYQESLISPTIRSGMVSSRSSPNIPTSVDGETASTGAAARGRHAYGAQGHFSELAADALTSQAGYYQGRSLYNHGRNNEAHEFDHQQQTHYAQHQQAHYPGYPTANVPYSRYGHPQQHFDQQAYYGNPYGAESQLMGRSMPYQQQYAAGYYNHTQAYHQQQQHHQHAAYPNSGYAPSRPSAGGPFGKPTSSGASASSGSPRAF